MKLIDALLMVLAFVCLPLVIVGWILGFMSKFFSLGFMYGRFHYEIQEEKRQLGVYNKVINRLQNNLEISKEEG